MILKGKTAFYGVELIDGKTVCEGCKKVNPPAKHNMHMDFTDKYVDSYTCNKCGNAISIKTKRSKQDQRMW